MNRLFATHLPLVDKEHWENGVNSQLTALAAKNCLYGLPNIALTLDIY